MRISDWRSDVCSSDRFRAPRPLPARRARTRSPTCRSRCRALHFEPPTVMATPRIPVSILTGFLGAGKSTLLNRILKDPATTDTAVIINEFGEVGIDNLLVESSGDTLVQLSNGCLCCTGRGDLVDTLAGMMDAIQTGRLKPETGRGAGRERGGQYG